MTTSQTTTGEYEILKEFSYERKRFRNKMTNTTFPMFGPTTDSRGNPGLCRYYVVHDVCRSRSIIQEATRPPKTSKYFGQAFGHVPSVVQLVDTKYNGIGELLNYVQELGVTSDGLYNNRKAMADLIHTTGLIGGVNEEKFLETYVRFKIDGYCSFEGSFVQIKPEVMGKYFDVESIENLDKNLCISHLLAEGPIIGIHQVFCDTVERMNQQFIYEPLDETAVLKDRNGIIILHGAMVIGFGLARHTPSNRLLSYFVVRNNNGEFLETYRMASKYFLSAYAPLLDMSCNLVDFVKKGGSETMALED